MISTTWQTLNGLRKADGRLVYDTYGNRYSLLPDRRVVGKGVITDLLERQYIQRAADGPSGVYTITEKGRRAWERTPENVSFSGECDGCGITTQVRPKRLEWECVYLCDGCIRELTEAADGVQETTPTARM